MVDKELFTYKQARIEEAEKELQRWKEEETHWCHHLKDVTRKRDACLEYVHANISDIMIKSCNSCTRWGKND